MPLWLGLIMSQLLTLYTTPVVSLYFDSLQHGGTEYGLENVEMRNAVASRRAHGLRWGAIESELFRGKAARRAFVLQGRFRRFFSNLGPGLITGAADDDPSGIATYSVTGAAFGYSLLWTAIFSFPLMAAVQIMCTRLGLVTWARVGGRDSSTLSAVDIMERLCAASYRQYL